MDNGLTTDILKRGLERMTRKMEACCDELNALDSQVGDGDIGVTMVAGLQAVSAVVSELPADVGLALAACGQAFVRDRGSSFGTLFATGVLAAAKDIRGEAAVSWNKIPGLLERSIERILQRGRGKHGDKTMLDALEAVRCAIVGMDDPGKILDAADAAVSKVIDDFKQRPCQQGRARMFGEKTIGLDDPGMMVIRRLIESFKDNQQGQG